MPRPAGAGGELVARPDVGQEAVGRGLGGVEVLPQSGRKEEGGKGEGGGEERAGGDEHGGRKGWGEGAVIVVGSEADASDATGGRWGAKRELGTRCRSERVSNQ